MNLKNSIKLVLVSLLLTSCQILQETPVEQISKVCLYKHAAVGIGSTKLFFISNSYEITTDGEYRVLIPAGIAIAKTSDTPLKNRFYRFNLKKLFELNPQLYKDPLVVKSDERKI